MKRAAAIVTDHGGRTSHAAIVSRELGLPAIVGTGNATQVLHDEQEVTVSCAEGDEGFVYEGTADFEAEELDLADIPATRTQVMLNLANPAAAFRWWRLPADGVGLARMEFVVEQPHQGPSDGARPLRHAQGRGGQARDRRADARLRRTRPSTSSTGWRAAWRASPPRYYPKPVIVRMSDFKTNEYANLIGGAEFEPKEENPMIGFRGASRYYSPRYREGFALECRAIRRLREEMGFRNVVVMIPFCRSTEEADRVLAVMAENGLRARRERARGLRDVRDPVERHPRQGVRRALRRLLDRQQRPDAAHARRRSRLGGAGRAVRRAGRGGEVDDRERHRARRTRPAPRSASAARRRAIIPSSPSSSSSAASIRCPSAPTASSRSRSGSRPRRPRPKRARLGKASRRP